MPGCTSGHVYQRLPLEYMNAVKQDLVTLANLGANKDSPLFSDESSSTSTDSSTSTCSSHSRTSTKTEERNAALREEQSFVTSTPKNKRRAVPAGPTPRIPLRRMPVLSPMAHSTVSIPIRSGNDTAADFMAANGGEDVIVAQTGGGFWWAKAFPQPMGATTSKGTGTLPPTKVNTTIDVRAQLSYMYTTYN